jgi:hypothetical protein
MDQSQGPSTGYQAPSLAVAGWIFIFAGLAMRIIAIGSAASMGPSTAVNALTNLFDAQSNSSSVWRLAMLNGLNDLGLICLVIGTSAIILNYLRSVLRP